MSIRIMSLVFDSDLPHVEKFVLLAMADYAADSGESIFPAVGTLAHKTSLSDRSVQNAIKALMELGYLEMVKKGGGRNNTNRYRIICTRFTVSAMGESGTLKGESGTLKGAPDAPDSSLTINNHHMEINELEQDATKPKRSRGLSEQAVAIATALSEVTGMSLTINRAQIYAEAKQLEKDPRVSPELIRIIYGPGGAWYKKDWRGQAGQKPTLYIIRATLFTFEQQEAPNVIKGGLKDRPVKERGGLK